jgi:formyltetrahydrofolate deformylase
VTTAVLLLSCADQRGLVHGVAEFVLRVGGNIVHAEQHVDKEAGIFFQRVEFTVDDAMLTRAELGEAFVPVAQRFGMKVRLHFTDERPRLALLASREVHCLADLLGRWRSGELPAQISVVVSNHPDHADLAAFTGVPFFHLPVDQNNRGGQDQRLLGLLRGYDVETVVLARYMQILGPSVLDAFPSQIINIHHSFLPAFIGAKPYHQAQARGVKLIGATAHYATADLDEGPIIAQDVATVSHRDSVADLVGKGRDLETVVLARAVRAHVERRSLVFGNKTIVFG